jgi:hypothetical protein
MNEVPSDGKLIRYSIKFILSIFHHWGPNLLTGFENIANYLFISVHLGVFYSKNLTQRFLRINTERKKVSSIQFEVITPVTMNMTLHILMEVY